MEPASIRYKNPGAMWGGNAISKKWGEQGNIVLNDGKGQGNTIAVFPSYVAGICAQLDLWRTSARYKNKKFCDAIAIWSGGNSVESYIAFVLARVKGMDRNTVLNDAFWRGPMGIPFLKAQAWHEAGKQYPAPDADWIEAQRIVMGGGSLAAPVKPAAKATVTTAAVVIAPTAATVAVAAHKGWSWLEIGLSAFIAAGVVTAIILLIKKVRA